MATVSDGRAASEGKPEDPFVGQVFGERYRLERRLGIGGMGTVYLAHHVTIERAFAVKVLHARFTADPAVAKRFDREGVAASKLDHPNCMQVVDAGTTASGAKYIVMPLLEGKELRAIIDGPLPVPRAVDLTAQILRGLEHAHKRGLVHRDLKPENVFVVEDEDGREIAKLVDFGIVKLLEPGETAERLTRAGVVFGTPAYMSPEQVAGGTIDARTDLYGVGVMLYEMLAGKPPFDADEPGILMRMHVIADPPPLPDHVPGPLAALVQRLLAKTPSDRPASAHEARQLLAAAAATLPGKTILTPMPPSGSSSASVRIGTAPPPPSSAVLGVAPTVASPSALGTAPTIASPSAIGVAPTVASASVARPSFATAPTVAASSAAIPIAAPPNLSAPRAAVVRSRRAVIVMVVVPILTLLLPIAIAIGWTQCHTTTHPAAAPPTPAAVPTTPPSPAAVDAAPGGDPVDTAPADASPTPEAKPRAPTRTRHREDDAVEFHEGKHGHPKKHKHEGKFGGFEIHVR